MNGSIIPYLQEFAPPSPEIVWRYYLHPGSDDAIQQILRSEAISGKAFPTVYHLFNEMEDKDGHLFSVLQTRKIGVLSRERRILPASDSEEDVAQARFVEETLEETPEFEQALFNLLDALAKGFSVLEILWDVTPDGRVRIRDLKSRFQGRFLFGRKGELRLLDPPEEIRRLYLNEAIRNSESPLPNPTLFGVPVPERKFLIFTFDRLHDNPYGRGLCARSYWYYWFKKNNLKFWAIYNEKFGTPTVVARYRPGITEEEHRRLLEVLDALQTDTGVTLPEDVRLEYLEAHRTASINSYRELADWCNDEISKIVLGQTLTASEGRRSGSLALGRVHQLVRFEYIMSDARSLMNVINSQLIPWLIYFNFGEVRRPLPRLVIDTTPEEELDRQIEIDRQLIGLGVPLPLSYFYKRYRRPAPLEGERSLRYDDNNLYQYHLQYGVLTINEVRATLGLPPVPWGDERPFPYTALRPSGEAEGRIKEIRPIRSRADNRLEEQYPEISEVEED